MQSPPWLAPFRPLVPLTTLVTEVNNIYHSFDARNYDSDHLELRVLWPGLWLEMMRQLPRGNWRVLDFGCGTGFEADQILQFLGSNIETLVAYDPSPEMLDQCRSRLSDNQKVIFTDTLPASDQYNLLITNSVLHHLADVEGTLSSLGAILSRDAYWLAGNEPSINFYRNSECVRLSDEYSKYRERIKWFEPRSYTSKLRKLLGRHTLSATASTAVQRGLFAKRPSDTVIDRLVDFHVPHSVDEVGAGRGLDLSKMKDNFMSQWNLLWSTTYSYLGPFSEVSASQRWRDKARRLKERFPSDGANFCAVWSRPV